MAGERKLSDLRHPIQELLPEIEKLATRRLSRHEIGLLLRIPLATWYGYLREFPEIEETIVRGYCILNKLVTDKIVTAADKGDLKACMWIAEKMADHWKPHAVQVNVGGQVGVTVGVGGQNPNGGGISIETGQRMAAAYLKMHPPAIECEATEV